MTMRGKTPELIGGFIGGIVVAALGVAALIRNMERQIDHIAGIDEWHNATRRTSLYDEPAGWTPIEWGDA